MDGKDDAMPLPARPDTRFTYEDFLLFPDDGKRHEIIDGEHYLTPSPNTHHQRLVGRLYYAIETSLRAQPGTGQIFVAPFDVILSNWDIVEPDLLFIAADQADILTDKNVQGPPALVVEIFSRGTRKRDEQIKRHLFERSGVREYWVVDPELDVVTVFRRADDGAFPRVAELSRENGDVLTTPLLAGFALALAELFAG
jgi:Uma2 family endonuclease